MAGLSTISAGIAIGFIIGAEELNAGDLVILNNDGQWVLSTNRETAGLYGIVDNQSGFKTRNSAGRALKIRIFGIISAKITTTTQAYSIQSNIVTAGINGLVEINGTGQPLGFLTQNVELGDSSVSMTIMNGIGSQTVSNLTAAQVKALYESNPDTNVFDDAAQSKLQGIESGATIDQNASEVPANPISGVTGNDVQEILESLKVQINNITNFGGFQGTWDSQNDPIPTKTGTILAGEYWRVINAGTSGRPFGTERVFNGDIVFANVDGASSPSDFTVISTNRAQDLTDIINRIVTIETKLATIEPGAQVNPNAATIKSELFSNSDTNNLNDSLLNKLNDIPNNSSGSVGDFIRLGTTEYKTITLADLVALVNAKSAMFPPNNPSAIIPPTASNDSVEGYEIGSLWFDQTNEDVYIATSVVAANAVWARVTLSPSQVKELYESNINTNVYTNKEKAELLAIPKPSNSNENKIIFIEKNGYSVLTIEQLQAKFTQFKYQFQNRSVNVSSTNIDTINFSGLGVFTKSCGNILKVTVPGGGGLGGGHIIENADGDEFEERIGLRFEGTGVQISDNPEEDATVVNFLAGDGVDLPVESFQISDWSSLDSQGRRTINITHNLDTTDINIDWYKLGIDGTVEVPWSTNGNNEITGCIKADAFAGFIRITAQVNSSPQPAQRSFTQDFTIDSWTQVGTTNQYGLTFTHELNSNSLQWLFYGINNDQIILDGITKDNTNQLSATRLENERFSGTIYIERT